MSRFAAVIFDLDGTLIDTERQAIEIGLTVLSGMGFPVARDFLTSLVGVDEIEGQRRLAAHVGPGLDLGRLDAEWRAATRQAQDAGIPPMAGVEVLLADLARRGLPRAVATNSATASAVRKLRAAGLHGHFDMAHVVGFDAVPRAKPAPDLFVEAARRLGAAPSTCIAFEDSDTGTAAALAAGMTVVQIPDISPARTRRAHHLAESLLEGARAAGLID
ncbi:HAD family phosphatase [Ostreiculturibacter nitratireducens]|uniref:HAD family hydrolase n=1 Tax=Ostreiculturibacter nitratireducens TaxID=3075226 RepID=UPI0031B59C42